VARCLALLPNSEAEKAGQLGSGLADLQTLTVLVNVLGEAAVTLMGLAVRIVAEVLEVGKNLHHVHSWEQLVMVGPVLVHYL